MTRNAFALIGALTVALLALLSAAGLLVLRGARKVEWDETGSRDGELHWSETGEAVETYDTFTLPGPRVVA